MGSSLSSPAAAAAAEAVETDGMRNIPDTALSSNITTAEENARKRKAYAHLKSAAAAADNHGGFSFFSTSSEDGKGKDVNVIEKVYNEDFDTIDHIQAMRFPPYVAKQIKDAVRNESERRCAEQEKTMSRCLQDKMWTSWKCQKERDVYYHCVEDEERRNLSPRHPSDDLEGATASAPPAAHDTTDPMKKKSQENSANVAVEPAPEEFVDLLTAYRWKFNLGVLHGEIIGRNNVMRKLWKEHFPDRELPHPWVKDE